MLRFYNFEVEDNHDYFVGQYDDSDFVLAHNGDCVSTVLYQKVGPNGEHLKFEITDIPAKRYTKAELGGGKLRILARGDRTEMLRLERNLHENLPIGPEEGQRFYIDIQVAKGLRPPPY